jgi:hypothetical protein
LLGRIKTDTTYTAISTLFTWLKPGHRVNGCKVCEICEAYSEGWAIGCGTSKTTAAMIMFWQNAWFDEEEILNAAE